MFLKFLRKNSLLKSKKNDQLSFIKQPSASMMNEKKKNKNMKGNTHLPKTIETNTLPSLANASLNIKFTDPQDRKIKINRVMLTLRQATDSIAATDNDESYRSKPPNPFQ